MAGQEQVLITQTNVPSEFNKTNKSSSPIQKAPVASPQNKTAPLVQRQVITITADKNSPIHVDTPSANSFDFNSWIPIIAASGGAIIAGFISWLINKGSLKNASDIHKNQLRAQEKLYERQIEAQKTFYSSQRQEEISEKARSNTIDMWREFNSEPMLNARSLVGKNYIRGENKRKDLVSLYNASETGQDLTPVFRIIYFFEGLNLLRETGKLDEKVAKKLFSFTYTWWFDNYFIYQIESVTEHWERVSLYYEWLYDKGLGKTDEVEINRIKEFLKSKGYLLHT